MLGAHRGTWGGLWASRGEPDGWQRGVSCDLALQGELLSLHGEGGTGGRCWPEAAGGRGVA